MGDLSDLDHELSCNLATLRGRIQGSATAAGRKPTDIALLAVSKGQSAERVAALHRLGVLDFGENYAQELFAKQKALGHLPIKWHYIGQIQSNKLDRIVAVSESIQTVGNLRHAQLAGISAYKHNKIPFPIFIQVNADAEISKGGVPLPDCEALYQSILREVPQVIVQGIMAIPASDFQDADFEGKSLPSSYVHLEELALRIGLGQLSLGMSGDLDLAIRAGSTCVRIGRALLGERAKNVPAL